MKLSKKALEEFKDIYKAEYGIELSDAEAMDKGYRLLRLFRAIYKPVINTKQDNYGKSTNVS